jgi:hypothetical protein
MGRSLVVAAAIAIGPSAAALERSDFAEGLSVEGAVGGVGFLTVANDVAAPGPLFGMNLGYDLLSWASVRAGFEGSLHETDAAPPPPRTTFEVYYPSVGARFLVPLSLRFSILFEGDGGVAFFEPDILQTYGFSSAGDLQPFFAAHTGLDIHSWGRRLAWGLRAGYRHLTSVGDGALSASVYLRHTF